MYLGLQDHGSHDKPYDPTHQVSNESSQEVANHHDTLETLSTTLKEGHLPVENFKDQLTKTSKRHDEFNKSIIMYC